MGNEKSNGFWEAELPPNYDRVGIENFIRAKYVDNRWAPREKDVKSPDRLLAGSHQNPRSNGGRTFTNKGHQSPVENRNTRPSSPSVDPSLSASRSVAAPVHPEVTTEQVQQRKAKPSSTDVLEMHQSVADMPAIVSCIRNPLPVVTPPEPKLDYATELFNMLSMPEPPKTDAKTSAAADDNWAGFQSVTATPVEEKIAKTEPIETKAAALPSGIEGLFTDTWPTTAPVSQHPPKDSKDDILNLFSKSGMVSPFSMHQQQLAALAQQQSLLMARAPPVGGTTQAFTGNLQNWGAAGPGSQRAAPQMMMTAPMQMGNIYSPNNSLSYSSPTMYNNTRPVGVNGVIRPQSSSPLQPHTPTKSGNEYDFSSLMQGMYTRR